MVDKKLAAQINSMAAKDQKMRLAKDSEKNWDADLDQANTLRLKEIVSEHGWPTIKLVGKKASFNAWLLAQHADHDLGFQKKALRLMKTAHKADSESVHLPNIAFLTDRVLVAEKKPQVFGTQFYRNRAGKWQPRPIKALKDIEKRRSDYGMWSFSEDLKSARSRK